MTLPIKNRFLARIQPPRQVILFIAVGCGATAVHWCVVVGLVELLVWPPLVANLIGWLVALVVSFLGHYRLTFREQQAPIGRAAFRFLLVSGIGFSINQAAYALLLAGNANWYWLKLAAVLVGVALVTYVLSRHWAFLRH